MDLLTFIFMILSIIFIFKNKYIGIVFLASLFNILYLLFAVVLNKKSNLTKLGAIELSISIITFICASFNLFLNINLFTILFK